MIRIESNQQTKRNNAKLMLAATTGAAAGAASRFVLPSKNELISLKKSSDSFFSSASLAARGAKRPILKYAAIGALIATGIHAIAKAVKKPQKQTADTFEYSKYQAIIDAPEYACEILLYDD